MDLYDPTRQQLDSLLGPLRLSHSAAQSPGGCLSRSISTTRQRGSHHVGAHRHHLVRRASLQVPELVSKAKLTPNSFGLQRKDVKYSPHRYLPSCRPRVEPDARHDLIPQAPTPDLTGVISALVRSLKTMASLGFRFRCHHKEVLSRQEANAVYYRYCRKPIVATSLSETSIANPSSFTARWSSTTVMPVSLRPVFMAEKSALSASAS